MKHSKSAPDARGKSKKSRSSGKQPTLLASRIAASQLQQDVQDVQDLAVLKSDWDTAKSTDTVAVYKYDRSHKVVRMTKFQKLKSNLTYKKDQFAKRGNDDGSWWAIVTGSVQ